MEQFMTRAERSGVRLSTADASIVKGMLKRGDRHHDIAAWFGVNQGRIAEVNDGTKHREAPVAPERDLPPAGPYNSGRAAHGAFKALEKAKSALENALLDINQALKAVRDVSE
jgi:hypothetical protein